MSAIELGAFRLDNRLGRGGMGEVWRATHRDGTSAAVKVLGGELASRPESRRALDNEIRAIAALDHPAIVAVYDAGVVEADAEEVSAGALSAGSPWVAMELCSLGNLTQCRPRDWSELECLLLSLLDALGHVHARGIVHRDLKPENVLRSGLDSRRPGWRLADFGIAHLLGGPLGHGSGTGTPLYMAPEQIRKERWRLGPATDLYALGCLAWEQAAGRHHRQPSSLQLLLQAQATEPLPPLVPAMSVPAGLEEWIQALTRLEVNRRPSTAAEAALRLAELGPPATGSTPLPAPDRRAMATFALTAALDLDLDLTSRRPSEAEFPAATRRPLPGWELPSDGSTGLRMGDVGLGLLVHRTTPLVGRRPIQDALWAALQRAIDGHRTEVVWLRGARGLGKSRLAQWAVERSAELGVARPFRIRFGHGPVDMLRKSSVAEHGVEGLARDEQILVLRRQGVGPEQAAALASWWTGQPTPPATAVALTVARWAALARAGPLVVWLDDPQRDARSLELIERLVGTAVPALVLLASDDEETAMTPWEGEITSRIGDWGGTVVGVEPLQGTDRHALVHAALSLEPALAGELAERSGGNPGLAIAWMHQLASRNSLHWTPYGYGLLPGREVPRSEPGAVWLDRLEDRLADLPADAANAIRVGGLVGPEVPWPAWRTACEAVGLLPDASALEPLARAALIRLEPDGGWSFANAGLAELAGASLPSEQRRQAHAALAAAATDPRLRAAHHLAAGSLEQALDPLVDAAEALVIAGQQKLALARMEQWTEAARAVGLESADPRRIKGLSRLAAVHRQLGHLSEAEALCEQVRALGQPDSRWVAAATAELGAIHGIRGDPERGRTLLTEAAALFEQAGERLLAEGCRVSVAIAYVTSGQIERARAILDAMAPVDGRSTARLARARAIVAMHQDRTDSARTYFLEARDAYRSHGTLHGLANIENDLGALEMLAGRVEEALVHFTLARERFEALGAYQAGHAALNIAQIHAERGAWAEARATAEPVLARWGRQDNGEVALPRAILLSVAAGLRDWGAFDRHLDALERDAILASHLQDVQMSLARAVQEAQGAGQLDRASRAQDWAGALAIRTRQSG